jgi:SAM-dependent methyltransferase
MAGEPDDVDAMVEPVVPDRRAGWPRCWPPVPATWWSTWAAAPGIARPAAPAVPGGLLVGLDLSAAALGRAGEAVAGVSPSPGLLLVQAHLKARLPLADAAIDRVICHNVLEVLPDPGALIAEAVRALRPDGRLVLAHSDFDTLTAGLSL